MSDDIQVRVASDLLDVPPALAAALVAAQKAVAAVVKRGHNKQLGKSYATADDIAATAKEALNESGAAFVRLGTTLHAPALENYDLGGQGYTGDVAETWMIVHESGPAIIGVTTMPVVVAKARPHEKSVSAVLTYGAGVTLRGVLCMEREEKGAVDRREDGGGRGPAQQSRPVDIGPRCTGKSAPIALAIVRRVKALAERDDASAADVWDWAIDKSGVATQKYVGEHLRPETLTISDGKLVSAILSGHLGDNDPTSEAAP